MRATRLVAAVAAVLLLFPVRSAGSPKNVLIVRGEAADLPGGTMIVNAIETTMRTTSPVPLEFYVEVIDSGHFPIASYDRRFTELLAEKYRGIPFDLVVAFAQPAVEFALRERQALFPRTPLLFGLVERRLFDEHALPPQSSIVYVEVGVTATMRLALQAYPAARRWLVVGGRSPFDRGWERVVRDDLLPFEASLPIAYDFDSSLDVLTRRVGALPSDTAVLYVSMTRDGDDQPVRPIQALERLRGVATVPIFGISSTYIGHGVVGSVVVDFARHGEDLAHQAAAMLAGALPPPATTRAAPMADARELRRFTIAVSQLPPATAIAFREPGLWETQGRTILIAAVIVGGQSALIAALVRAGRRRRDTQRQFVKRVQVEQLLSEFSVSVATAPVSGVPEALDTALSRLAPALGFERVVRWTCDDPRDAGWDALRLRAAQAATIGSLAELPPSVRERLGAVVEPCSVLAVPLSAAGLCTGALFWIARRTAGTWPPDADQFRGAAAVVATVLQRSQAEAALQASNELRGAILDSLPASIAVLDREGIIIAVNDAWSRFSADNGVSAAAAGPGASYLGLCYEAVAAGVAGAAEVVETIERACRGESSGLPIEYRADSRRAYRWFVMTAEPLRRPEGGTVVTHWEITARKQNEIALRESEDRFRHLADALPVAIWMSDTEGACTYFNRGWFELTGRALEDEYGDGWLEGVHVADQAACMDIYLRALHSRQPFRMEYRMRCHDGEYRWLIHHGVPRYGNEGAFHGYIGGCFDITDSKDAEQALRGLNRRLMSAQDDERRRIARELHDHLGQQLALLAIDLQQLSMHRPASWEGLTTALQEAWRRTTEIASDVHSISHRLHPAKMEALGLVATMRAHCRDVSRQSLVAEFIDQDVPRDIPPDRALSLFRILEEALSNVVRHSGARSAHVALAGSDGDVVLRIADDGRGFDERDTEAGLGLISIRERVQALDGNVSMSSHPGRGTVIEVRVPAAARAPIGDNAARAAPADSA
jgi:PAS domain S-box-containing protein